MIEVGDIFFTSVPFEEDPRQSKPRPVVVLRKEGNGLVLIGIFTGTNKTGFKKGLWILKESEDGVKMGLTKDTFIIVDKKYRWPEYQLTDYFGHCHLVEELLQKL